MPPNNTNVPSSLKAGDPLHQKFLDILKSNNIKDEVDEIIVHNPEELKGEHFGGATLYVKIKFKDPSVKELNLFAKQSVNEMMKFATIKESTFYTQFLPKARELCKKYEGTENLLKCFPKCWYGGEDLVVLDNLVLNDNWIMLNKFEKQDLHTAKMVLKNLAGYHAVSYVFIEEECGGLDKAEKEVMPDLCKEVMLEHGDIMLQKMMEGGITNSMTVLKTYVSKLEEGSISPKSPNDLNQVQETIQVLQALMSSSAAGKFVPHISGSMKRKPEDKFVVLNHGDFHGNNMLFKMDKDGKKVTDNVFVDLQCTRLCSPNVDIAYYLYTSVKGPIRRAHFHELLQHYYDSLQESLALLGGRKCPSELLDNFTSSSPLGFFLGFQGTAFLHAMSNLDASDFAEHNPEDFMNKMMGLIKSWIHNNPQKAIECVSEMVETMKEYKKLGGIEMLLKD